MDTFGLNKSGAEQTGPTPEPIRLADDEDSKTIPFDDGGEQEDANVSHPPLTLGGGRVRPSVAIGRKPSKKKVSTVSVERITGVKTFFTKLHIGSIDFLDEQINTWLEQNPGIDVKRTNTVTGMVTGKKSEPNIIVTIWY